MAGWVYTEQLTGSIISPEDEVPIQDGKIDGDHISFHVMRRRSNGNEVKAGYTGTVASNELKLTMTFGNAPGRAVKITAKKLQRILPVAGPTNHATVARAGRRSVF